MKKLIVLSLFVVLGTIVYAQNDTTSKGYISPYSRDDKFHCVDGVLFIFDTWEKRFQTLVKYPQSKSSSSYTIPDGVETIARGAFQGNKYIQTLRIPSSVIYIGDNAFDGCEQLRSIEVYNSANAVRAVDKEESPSNTREVGRYNIQGVKIQEGEDGQVQIILYSDGTSQKIIE